jgi:hypothetical protein
MTTWVGDVQSAAGLTGKPPAGACLPRHNILNEG